MKNVFYLSGFGYNKRVEKKESVRITACIFVNKLVDCLEKCLICRHIRRFAD